jgi:hypothetical protein
MRGSRSFVLFLVLLVGWRLTACTHSAHPLTVTLTFDNGFADDVQFAKLLEARGLKGTFYLSSGLLGQAGYLTVAQARALDAAGHELAGYTVSGTQLSALSADDAQRQICNDRANLVAYGFEPRSFAYPGGDSTAAIEALVSGCGYNSGRVLGPKGAGGNSGVDTIPPKDSFAEGTARLVDNTMGLADLQRLVTDAEQTGGWLHLVFHHLCDGKGPCAAPDAVSGDDFAALLDWLVARGIKLELERDVIGGSFQALVPLDNPVVNPSLEVGDGGQPFGFQRILSGTNVATWTSTTDAHTGQSAQRVDLSGYLSGLAVLVPTRPSFSLPGTPGQIYQLSVWYKSTVQPKWILYFRDQLGSWSWWMQSPLLPIATNWTQATFMTPWLPANGSGITFGLAAAGNGSLTVDDFALSEVGQAPTGIVISAPAKGKVVRGTVPISVDAVAPAGVARVDVFVSGTEVGTGPGGAYTVSWDSKSVTDGPVTLTASVLDRAGTTVQATPVQVTVNNHGDLLINPSLENLPPPDALPDCWTRIGFGDNTAAWSTSPDGHDGGTAQRVDISAYASGAQRLVPTQDTSFCAPPGIPTHRYRVAGWYKATAQPRWVVYYRNASGAWLPWLQGDVLPVAADYAPTSFDTPSLPADGTALSFGLSLNAVGSLTVDDFSLVDLGAP